ncbi:polyamine-modulated factor 1 [Scomber japonicus]|uniref:polyamine-modulated factor 1 n=1 Tax=Scomber japonicus TaxID=13676 RepID=UPI002306C516|nr:polyamine-modulated factor 1 [Scomber japonicus]
MEQTEAETQKNTVDNVNPAEKQTGKATGEASSQMSEAGAICEPEARWSRLKLFDKVMQKSLDKFIGQASFNTFARTFRPLYKNNPQKMESIHRQFIEELRRIVQEDISRLTEEGKLESKLNELDKLESAAKNNLDPAWRPSGIPEQDFCSFLKPYYKKQEAYMRLELKKIQAENAALAQKVQAGRESVAQTEHCILTTVDEWKASVTEFERMKSNLCPSGVNDSGIFDV